MPNRITTLNQLRERVTDGHITKAQLMKATKLDWKTVDSAIRGNRKTHPLTVQALLDSANVLLDAIIPVDSKLARDLTGA